MRHADCQKGFQASGKQKALAMAVRNNRTEHRLSGLLARLIA
jgi:hypothetical protein